MKQAKFIIPFAAAILLAGCSAGGETNTSSSNSSNESYSITPVESSDIDSSESKEEPIPAVITIADLKNYASKFSSNASKINSGAIVHKSEDAYSSDSSTTSFTFGSDANGDTLKVVSGSETFYVMKDSGDNVVTVIKQYDGSYTKPQGPYATTYSSIAPQITTALDISPIYGVENFFSALVTKAEKNVNKDFAAATDGDKIYFSFGYYEDQLTVYNVTASFDIGETLTGFTFVIEQYSGSDKYTFDSTTSTFSINEGEEASGTDAFSIVQTVGDRTYTNDVNLADFEFKTLSLTDSSGDELDTINATEISNGESFRAYISGSPDGASVDFDPLSWSITSGDAEGLSGSINYDWDSDGYVLDLEAQKVGDYVVEVKSSAGKASASFALKVSPVEVKGLSVRVYSEDPNGEYVSKKLVNGQPVEATTTQDYNYLYFVPNVKTGGKSGAYTATITDANGDEIEIDDDDDDFYFNENDWFEVEDEDYIKAIGFYSNDAGEYKLTITAKDDATYKQTFTINVVDTDPIDVLTKSYIIDEGEDGKNTITFKDYDEDHYSGTMVLTGEDGSETEAAYTIKNEDESYSTFVFSEDDEGLIPYYLTYGADGKLYYSDEEGGWADPLYASDSYEYDLFKTWSGTDSDNGDYTMTLSFTADGIASGKIVGRGYTYDFRSEYTAYEYSSGYYEIKFMDDGYIMVENTWFGDESENEYSFNKTGDWDKDSGCITLTASYLGLSFNLSPSED